MKLDLGDEGYEHTDEGKALSMLVDQELHESRERSIAQMNDERHMERPMHEGFGQSIAEIPADMFYQMNYLQPGCWHDKAFVDRVRRDNPSVVAGVSNAKPRSRYSRQYAANYEDIDWGHERN